MTRFRIATYNVHKCRGIDWRVSPARVAKVLGEIGADIIALQEIFSPQADHLSDLLESPRVFGFTRHLDGREYGNAVLSRLPLTSIQNHDLTVIRREPRGCLQMDIQISEVFRMRLFAVHLGTSYFERRQQAAKLISPGVLGDSSAEVPRLVTGDFNEWTRGLVSSSLSRMMQSADIVQHLRRTRTYPGVLPVLHLDHMYYDAPLALEGMHLHRSRTAFMASDHLPLVGDFVVARDSVSA